MVSHNAEVCSNAICRYVCRKESGGKYHACRKNSKRTNQKYFFVSIFRSLCVLHTVAKTRIVFRPGWMIQLFQ